MGNFKTPLLMEVTKEQYDRISEGLIALGYYKSSRKHTNSDKILVTSWRTNCNSFNSVSSKSSLSLDNPRLEVTNSELFLALAAMTEGDDWIVGEYVKVTNNGFNHNEIIRVNEIRAARADMGLVGQHATWCRKATEAELIAHFLSNTTKAEEPKTYEYNEGDLIVPEIGSWWDKGEIIKLGGKWWKEDSADLGLINAICRNHPGGNGTENIKFRKATQEEIDHYNKVGIGANINDMKTAPLEEEFYVRYSDEWTQDLLDAVEKWAISKLPEGSDLKDRGWQEPTIKNLSVPGKGEYYNFSLQKMTYYKGVDNHHWSIQTELSVAELKRRIGYVVDKPEYKYPVGTYVLFLIDLYHDFKAGRIEEITGYTSNGNSILEGYGIHHVDRFRDGESKWFATKIEAEQYWESIKPKEEPKHKFIKGELYRYNEWVIRFDRLSPDGRVYSDMHLDTDPGYNEFTTAENCWSSSNHANYKPASIPDKAWFKQCEEVGKYVAYTEPTKEPTFEEICAKYPVGTKYTSAGGCAEYIVENGADYQDYIGRDHPYTGVGIDGRGWIYQNGKYAEIIEEVPIHSKSTAKSVGEAMEIPASAYYTTLGNKPKIPEQWYIVCSEVNKLLCREFQELQRDFDHDYNIGAESLLVSKCLTDTSYYVYDTEDLKGIGYENYKEITIEQLQEIVDKLKGKATPTPDIEPTLEDIHSTLQVMFNPKGNLPLQHLIDAGRNSPISTEWEWELRDSSKVVKKNQIANAPLFEVKKRRAVIK